MLQYLKDTFVQGKKRLNPKNT